ncbi:hypothetical protein CYMTET_8488, partial [Cymbomonas tetramitiformis]
MASHVLLVGLLCAALHPSSASRWLLQDEEGIDLPPVLNDNEAHKDNLVRWNATVDDYCGNDHPMNRWIMKFNDSYVKLLQDTCEGQMNSAEAHPETYECESLYSSLEVAAEREQGYAKDYLEELGKENILGYCESLLSYWTKTNRTVCEDVSEYLAMVEMIVLSTANTEILEEIRMAFGSEYLNYIERNTPVQLDQSEGGQTVGSSLWGLDRIDQQEGEATYNGNYNPGGTGSGVHVYIIDTGINAVHNDWSGRVGNGVNYIDNNDDPSDCHGHGTHCAGTAIGTVYGVAKQATLHGVKVLSCSGSGSSSGVISGVNWVAANRINPAVASMSLGGGFSQASNDAINSLFDSGVVVTTAAGNDNQDACSHSPASAEKSFTVASSTSSDTRSSFSNYGSQCTNMFAPGSSILSAWIGSSTATNTISGTSMATPHVAGVMALYLGHHPQATPAEVWQGLLDAAYLGIISDTQGTPNRLLSALVQPCSLGEGETSTD